MSKPYLVVGVNDDCYDFETKEEAVAFAKNYAKSESRTHYVYKLVADVVVETRTEVIEHE